MNIQLYPYQLEGVAYITAHHYCILADSMGLGKTYQALELIRRCKLPAIIVVPAYLVDNWKREISVYGVGNVNVVKYTELHKKAHLFRPGVIVICDEAHYLKNPDAKRTEAFSNLIHSNLPDRLLFLTGTPIKNRVNEIYTLLTMISWNPHNTSGKKLGMNYWTYCNSFMNCHEMRIGGRIVRKFTGVKNVDRLKGLLQDKFIRRLAENVLDLPTLNRINHKVPTREHHESLLKAFDDYINGTEGLGTSYAEMKAISALSKVSHTIELAESIIEQGNKVIIYSDHVKAATMIAEALSCNVITGATPMEVRTRSLDAFNASHNALVATIGSFSTGVNITCTNYMIFNDLSWVPGDNLQTEKRIHRIGQGKPCFIYRVLAGDVDEHIVGTITAKMKIVDKVI